MMNRFAPLFALMALLAATPVLAQPAALMRPGQPVVLTAPTPVPPPAPAAAGEAQAPAAAGWAPRPGTAPPPYGYPPQGYAAMGYGDGPPPLRSDGWRAGYHDDPADGRCLPPSGRGASTGALAGAALGFGLANRRERGVGLLIGGLVGGLTGSAIERSANRCR
ncbi:MAG: hypothetical protein KGQ52_03350 [Alphaproteobacteria bacterium]|nr:hypothetical protein [Alphaproteobacteria bacterium]